MRGETNGWSCGADAMPFDSWQQVDRCRSYPSVVAQIFPVFSLCALEPSPSLLPSSFSEKWSRKSAGRARPVHPRFHVKRFLN